MTGIIFAIGAGTVSPARSAWSVDNMIYRARACGVTILFTEGADVTWFFQQAIHKGAVVVVEKVLECAGSD